MRSGLRRSANHDQRRSIWHTKCAFQPQQTWNVRPHLRQEASEDSPASARGRSTIRRESSLPRTTRTCEPSSQRLCGRTGMSFRSSGRRQPVGTRESPSGRRRRPHRLGHSHADLLRSPDPEGAARRAVERAGNPDDRIRGRRYPGRGRATRRHSLRQTVFDR
jgi:hypothetical protein